MQALEENKVLAATLFNYSIYITGGKLDRQPAAYQQHEDMSPSIDEELNKLLGEQRQAQADALTGLKRLKKLINAQEPQSVQVLRSKNDKEKEYLQRTIIMMELKQFSESITMIAFKKRINQTKKEV